MKSKFRKNTFFNKFFIFVFSAICVALCVVVAQLFSSVLTTSEVSNTTSSINSGFKIYAISLGTFTSKTSADAMASTYQKRNAGGYVYKQDGIYYLLASAYENKNDADLVLDSLEDASLTAEIMTISFDSFSISKSSSVSQTKHFLEKIAILKSSFLKLYDISVSLDTSLFDDTKAKLEILSVKASIDDALNSLLTGSTTIDGLYCQMIKSKLEKVSDDLLELSNYEIENGIALSSRIKYAYISVLVDLKDLINLLNNKY